jgi:hypothetical protein
MGLASNLIHAYSEHPLGLCGQCESAQVIGSVEDVERRLTILTLGVVLDINPLTRERWSGLLAFAEHWLLDPSYVAYQSSQQVGAAMQEAGISCPQHIPRVWWQICRGVQGRFKGSWRDLMGANDYDALALQVYLRKSKTTFPVLAGPVVSARWLDLLHRIGRVHLTGWENLRVPLSKKQGKTAQLFGIEENEIHPQLFSALWEWPAACKKLSESSCGLSDCPRKIN